MNMNIVGFDVPSPQKNAFELFKKGKPYVSLYHDCELTDIQYNESKCLSLKFLKVFDTGYGPAFKSWSTMTFIDAEIKDFMGDNSSNFEDVNELRIGPQKNNKIHVFLNAAMLHINFACSGIEFHEL